MRNIISVQNLIKDTLNNKKNQRVLNDVSFVVREGQCAGLIGPNGAGKSTTIKILSGILWQTSGDVLINDINPLHNHQALAASIGVVFGHLGQLYGHLTVEQNFLYAKIIYGLNDQQYYQNITKLCDYFDIKEFFSKSSAKLSLGQKMQCEIALSLLHDPSIIFLDEPTIGLDMQAKKNFRSIIKKITKDHNKTLILTSHDMGDIADLCEKVIIINKGKVVYDDQLAKLKKQRQEYKTIHIITSDLAPDWQLQGCSILDKSYEKVSILINLTQISLNQALQSLILQCSFADISIEDEPLETIISNLYG
jgi:ABC-2 type transport system ATP-binding protein